MRYNLTIPYDTGSLSAREAHNHIDTVIDDGFDGVVLDKTHLVAVTGDLSESDQRKIEDEFKTQLDNEASSTG